MSSIALHTNKILQQCIQNFVLNKIISRDPQNEVRPSSVRASVKKEMVMSI